MKGKYLGINTDPLRPRWRGFSFALHLLRVQGFYFCPATIQPNTSVYSAFCVVHATIPPTPQNSAQGFAGASPAIAPAQPPTIPDRYNEPLHHLRHAGGHTNARTRSTDTRYHRHAGTLCRSGQAVYYNKVYKRVQRCAPLRGQRLHLSIWQGSARRGLDASHARRLEIWHRVSGQGGRAARNHWRLSPHLFSGFRPIANKGEQ